MPPDDEHTLGDSDASPPDADEVNWHVLHTKSRQEKALASSLDDMGIQYYLPLIRRVSIHGRRKVRVLAPLFPSYLFLHGTLDEAYEADRTKRVASIIRVVDQAHLEWELNNIKLALGKDAPLLPCPYITEGRRVVVRAGPFKGLEGVVVRRKKPDRIILQVDSFGKAVSLEIDADLLDPLD